MGKIAVFAGTTEGRILTEELASLGIECCVCVATEYGRQLLPQKGVRILTARMEEKEMEKFFLNEQFDCVVDATHPYAQKVTQNIRSACRKTQTEYFRLLREEEDCGQCMVFSSIPDAIRYLNQTRGAILVTTGSKELSCYGELSDASRRVYARVLPTVEGLRACESIGLSGSHIIAMQGPFSEELNLAMLRQTGASYLVTKDSGRVGGIAEKCSAAKRAGATVILIGRPPEDAGYSYQQLKKRLLVHYRKTDFAAKQNNFFPLFVSLSGKRVVVIGAGAIAFRRIRTLRQFSCQITVIAPSVLPEIHEMAELQEITLYRREYRGGDCSGAALVCSAADSREVNHAVYEECRKWEIPLSVADCKEECSFYFPAVVVRDDIVIGITSGGTDHSAVKQAADWIRSGKTEDQINSQT